MSDVVGSGLEPGNRFPRFGIDNLGFTSRSRCRLAVVPLVSGGRGLSLSKAASTTCRSLCIKRFEGDCVCVR